MQTQMHRLSHAHCADRSACLDTFILNFKACEQAGLSWFSNDMTQLIIISISLNTSTLIHFL